MENVDYNKYESYIRIGTSPQTLADFPTPSSLGRTLHDVDVDAYTDLEGYTQRNRVRHDVEDITLNYSILSDDDLAFILNAISPEWIYVELIDKRERADVKDSNNYIKYKIKNGDEIYWYDTTNNKLYDESYNEVQSFDLNDYKKITNPIKKIHKMYASDKEFNSFKVWSTTDENNVTTWHEQQVDFSVTLVEQ